MTFQKGQSGNPLGRPRGSRNKLTLLVERLLERDSATLVKKLIDVAKETRPRRVGGMQEDPRAQPELDVLILPLRRAGSVAIIAVVTD